MKTPQEKIEAFIAMANNSGASQAEKDMASLMAKKLILETGIVPDFENEKLYLFTYEESGRIENWKFVLWCQLCKFMGAYGVKKGLAEGNGKRLVFYGYESQVGPIFEMADHFFNTIQELGKSKHGYGRSYVASYKLGLAYGVVAKFETRLPEALQERAMVFLGSFERIKQELGKKKTKRVDIGLKNKAAIREGFYKGMELQDSKSITGSEKKAKLFLEQA